MASGEYLSTIDDIIEDARNGRMFILVDDEERENEGDLVIPAQMATPDAINFMATNGRGLICLALTQNRINQLNLHPMSQTNTSRHETAFTASIEAKRASPQAFQRLTAPEPSPLQSMPPKDLRTLGLQAMFSLWPAGMAGFW